MSPNFAIIPFFKLLMKIALLFLLSGCAKYRICTHTFIEPCSQSQKEAASSKLYQIVPRHRSQIKWYDLGHWTTWMLFGNDDDGLFGEAQSRPYYPNKKHSLKKAVCWWIRNPLHNFTFYTIGSAHRANSEWTLLNVNEKGIALLQYDPVGKNFGSKGSSCFLALHGGKPYLSLRINYPWQKSTVFYLGWRERGNFGFKLHPL